MAELVLGPVLRYSGPDGATVWVETAEPAQVEILGHRADTFTVADHHYAVVAVDGLEPGSVHPYDVRVDGEVTWPPPDDPRPSPVIRTPADDERTRIAFGSCRAAAPHREPWTLPAPEHEHGFGPDALALFGRLLRGQPHDEWPDLLLLLGDQVYADAASPATREFARSRRDTSAPPHDDVADFEEYTHLYRESWGQQDIRWLLATVPSAMIFDDHDVIDDWNISASWVAEIRATDWWHNRITGAFVSYWCYQHLGNLPPTELATDPLYEQVRGADDATELLFDFAVAADRDTSTARWSYHRGLGDVQLVVVDSRAGRRFEDGRRDMLDDAEWAWLEEELARPSRHLLVASSLPVLLPPAIHDVERWNEAVCGGAWGRLGMRVGEAVRRAIDLEHWSAFNDSFDRLTTALRDVVAGAGGHHPSTVAILSGDVHNGYASRATWDGVDRPLWQLVSSPLRQGLDRGAVGAYRLARSPVGRLIGTMLRRAGGLEPTDGLRWIMTDGPVTSNHIATWCSNGDDATFRLHQAVRSGDAWRLSTVVERPLD